MFFEFYLILVSTLVFLWSSDQFLQHKTENIGRISTGVLYIMAGYSFLREFREMYVQRKKYLHDYWNVFDLARPAFLMIAATPSVFPSAVPSTSPSELPSVDPSASLVRTV